MQLMHPSQYNQYKYNRMQCPTHLKKLEALEEAGKCSICGRAGALRCRECPFVQCEECRICMKRHGMLKIVDLSTVKPEYYNNAYACNLCSKSKTVDDDGIWHCSACNYDLCPDCAD